MKVLYGIKLASYEGSYVNMWVAGSEENQYLADGRAGFPSSLDAANEAFRWRLKNPKGTYHVQPFEVDVNENQPTTLWDRL